MQDIHLQVVGLWLRKVDKGHIGWYSEPMSCIGSSKRPCASRNFYKPHAKLVRCNCPTCARVHSPILSLIATSKSMKPVNYFMKNQTWKCSAGQASFVGRDERVTMVKHLSCLRRSSQFSWRDFDLIVNSFSSCRCSLTRWTMLIFDIHGGWILNICNGSDPTDPSLAIL